MQGVSTRSMKRLAEALGTTNLSRSQVSRICRELDQRVQEFRQRPIEGDWRFLWLDATYLKVRLDGHVRSVAVLIALGVDSEGRREVLGLDVVSSESRQSWSEFLRSLQHRGLKPVRLIISDEHEGLKAAIAAVMPSQRQRCRLRFMRNLLANVPRRDLARVAKLVRSAFRTDEPETAQESSETPASLAPSEANPGAVSNRWQLIWKFNKVAPSERHASRSRLDPPDLGRKGRFSRTLNTPLVLGPSNLELGAIGISRKSPQSNSPDSS